MNKKEHINQVLELVDRSRMPKSRLVDFSVLRTLLNENLPKQLIIADVVIKNVLNELYIAHNWHNQQMKEVEPLSRDYFIHYGRREGVRNAIEIITGEEM